MRGYLLLLLFSISILNVWANQNLSSEQLEQKVNSASTAEARIDAQNELCLAYLRDNKADIAIQLVRNTQQLARKSNLSDKLANSLDIEGQLFESKYDYTNAMKSYVEAMKLRDSAANSIELSVSKNNIGRAFLLQGETEKAIEHLTEALAIRENNNDKKASSETHQLLGDAFIAKGQPGSAKQHYKRAVDLKIELQDIAAASELATKLGKIESNLGAYDGALVYYNMSLDMNSSMEKMPAIARDYENIAHAYFAQDAVEEAIEANDVALNIWKELDNKIGLATVYKNLAVFKIEKGRKSDAKRYLERAAKQLKEIGTSPEAHQIYKGIAATYESLGDYKKAYQYHNAFAVTKDAFFSQEKSNALLELTTKYESEFEAEKKQAQITQLEIEQSSSKKVRTFLIALIGLIGALAATLYYSYRSKKRDNIALQERNEKIGRQKFEIDGKNVELKEKNSKLDYLNSKLVDEISERESIEQSSFARDRFLAGMSHEMRTPMNAIVGLTHLLLEENPKGTQIEHLRNLQFSANNLTVFINDILDFSKIEAGKLNLENRRFNPKKIFDEVFFRFKKPIENQGIHFNYEFDERVPEQLLGDPARLNQIINNLLSSSLQKTTDGTISLKVYLEEFNPKKILLKIVISDSGTGLSDKDMEKMFQTYWEQNGDIFEGYERSRMALAMAKRLVDLQNGKLDVQTKLGAGSEFTILIPCKQIEKSQNPQQSISQQSKAEKNLKNKRILVVEDNKINQLVVAKLLSNIGANVETVDNGKEAVQIVSEQDFDLILMDIQMPIMDGYKATAEIRNMKDPRKANIPIIALTASAFLSETEKAKLFGMNDHVGKPFGPDDLLEKIHACMDLLQPSSPSKA